MAPGDAGIDEIGLQKYFMHTQNMIPLTRKRFCRFKSAVDRNIYKYYVNSWENVFKSWIFEVFWNDTIYTVTKK